MRESFIFYKNFADAINCLSEKNQLKMYHILNRIYFNSARTQIEFETMLDEIETELKQNRTQNKSILSVFYSLKQHFIKSSKLSFQGRLGGAKEGNKNALKKQAKENLLVHTKTSNENENENENENKRKENTSYFLKEKNFSDSVSAESTIVNLADDTFIVNPAHNNTETNTQLSAAECCCNERTENREGAEGCAAKKTKKFIPPQLSAVESYCNERNNGIDPQKFVDFYEARGWMMNKTKMKDWKAAIRTWERQNTQASSRQSRYDFY